MDMEIYVGRKDGVEIRLKGFGHLFPSCFLFSEGERMMNEFIRQLKNEQRNGREDFVNTRVDEISGKDTGYVDAYLEYAKTRHPFFLLGFSFFSSFDWLCYQSPKNRQFQSC